MSETSLLKCLHFSKEISCILFFKKILSSLFMFELPYFHASCSLALRINSFWLYVTLLLAYTNLGSYKFKMCVYNFLVWLQHEISCVILTAYIQLCLNSTW